MIRAGRAFKIAKMTKRTPYTVRVISHTGTLPSAFVIVYFSRCNEKKNANNKGCSDLLRPTSPPLHRATNQRGLCYSHFSSRYSD